MSDFNYYSRTMEMVSSRICHDIVGPINTIENCQAMIDESLLLTPNDKFQSATTQSFPQDLKPEDSTSSKYLQETEKKLDEPSIPATQQQISANDSIIDESVMNIMREAISILSNRIKFYRLTFGQSGHTGINSNNLLDLITSYLNSTNVSLSFSSIINREDWPKGWAKLCLIGCYHAYLFAQRGGDINLKLSKLDNSNNFKLTIKAISSKLLINKKIIEILQLRELPEKQNVTTHTMPSLYLNLLLKNYDRSLTIKTNESEVTLEIV